MENKLSIIALVCLMTFAACNKEKEAKDNNTASEVIAVSLVPVSEVTDEAYISGSGLLSTENEMRQAFKIGGIIDRIYVNEGQSFKKGQLLATLKLTEIESGYTQADLGLAKAQRDYSRVENLYADSVATLEQLQNSQTALELAKQKLASVAFDKKYAFIYAEKPGFVVKKLANEGEVIAGGAPVLASSENGNKSWELKIGLSDKEWAKVAIGNKAKVMLEAFPEIWWEAQVFRKSGAADLGTGSFQVELKLDNLTESAAIGMFGKAIIQTGHQQKSKLIPYEALIEADGKQAYVFVPNGKNKVKKQPVLIESFSETGVSISEGLEGVSEIILGNSAFLNEFSTIQFINKQP
ncbi:efflux RND transporter periplasmic adaptor subunit [Belliella sp. DSM 107340]|uniref:Efflux RND transporter periplasmic adaptor subunit n=1 Tax=Belliella calami TaxID=2923436 RepID=A0ABS9UJF6_9BACT|nr:efflux RND transporter periplasmic adaptor subunit [Belliella calami]MCH7396756.1 efflux RND transporter periplasmic adaptor subunit [Belliella calami]